jgi:NAD(P)-dependent dehydrogenase (short-subunit alcohol dehydrogenase family)
MPLVAAYTASKYTIEGFSESLAYELGMFGVRVKIVEPGFAPQRVLPRIPANAVTI